VWQHHKSIPVVFGFVLDEFAMDLFLSKCMLQSNSSRKKFIEFSTKFNSQLMEDYKTHYSNDDDDDEIDWMNG
jgi:hypothetical protein